MIQDENLWTPAICEVCEVGKPNHEIDEAGVFRASGLRHFLHTEYGVVVIDKTEVGEAPRFFEVVLRRAEPREFRITHEISQEAHPICHRSCLEAYRQRRDESRRQAAQYKYTWLFQARVVDAMMYALPWIMGGVTITAVFLLTDQNWFHAHLNGWIVPVERCATILASLCFIAGFYDFFKNLELKRARRLGLRSRLYQLPLAEEDRKRFLVRFDETHGLPHGEARRVFSQAFAMSLWT